MSDWCQVLGWGKSGLSGMSGCGRVEGRLKAVRGHVDFILSAD